MCLGYEFFQSFQKDVVSWLVRTGRASLKEKKEEEVPCLVGT
jgi:hypothetical protein